ncbi:MAG TPA: heme ABC transporter ATP-binding protein, partial [Anaerolineae bacterium]|nr:heme ABC transporter ATP-binding protein [Anaerolineae bacterium]
GGNLQKLILAREISSRPALMVAVYPTRGLDVGATEAVRRLLLEQRDAGGGILLISEDLDELLSMSDRIAVLYEGRVMGVRDSEEASVEELGLMMAGTAPEDEGG